MRDLLRKVEDSLRALTPARYADGLVVLSVPVQYPSGAMATLEVSGGAEEVWISDRGMGFFEAEMMSADHGYKKAAESEAQRHGVKFDGRSIFAVSLRVGQLAAGIVAVANASAAAAIEAIRAESERIISEKNALIYDKVRSAFPNVEVLKEMDLDGARSSWAVHNVVRRDDQIAIFEPVVQHHASVSAKFLMFSDLAAKDFAVLNAVVPDPANMDAKGQMLRDVAHIIGAEEGVEAFRRSFIAA